MAGYYLQILEEITIHYKLFYYTVLWIRGFQRMSIMINKLLLFNINVVRERGNASLPLLFDTVLLLVYIFISSISSAKK